MNNFQLYRTNPLLSGQLKWDIVIESLQGDLYISDFHLTPISENISHTYRSDEYLVKNSHQDNVKEYYRTHKGEFYSNAIKSEFEHNWPMICKSGERLDAYSNMYDMGCRRTKHYSKYKKQFEFLCPLWLEYLDGDLSFKISIKYAESDVLISSRTIKLSEHSSSSFHNKFVEYFKNYISYVGIDKGNDDVLNIVFKDNNANITGLNALTGKIETTKAVALIDNLLSRERPLMESDSMIINSFADNSMICSQLFNFNLCFDISDIISTSVERLLIGKNVEVMVDAYVGDRLLERRDFYTEYEFINRETMNSNDGRNVLDYLKDYKCLELINKNKFCQSICHWSLNENPDYIFNVYEGFSGVYVDGGEEYENSHQYGMTPNINANTRITSQNSTGWINTYEIGTFSNFLKYIENTDKNIGDATLITGSSKFINNLKYENTSVFDEDSKNTYIIGLYIASSEIIHEIKLGYENSSYSFEEIYKDDNDNVLYNMVKEDNFIRLIMLITDNYDFLTFNKFNSILNGKDAENTVLDSIKAMMNSIVSPSMCTFNDSVTYTSVNGPTNDVDEIRYFKDHYFNYVFRYDGKIKPTFSKQPSSIYYKDYVSDEKDDSKFKKSNYYKYGNTNYEPLYPSIDYCSIKCVKDWSYNALPNVMTSEFDDEVCIMNKDNEYTWFDINSYCVILKEMSFEYVNTKEDDYESLDDIVRKYIKKYYNVEDSKAEFIKSLYDVKNTWEYSSITNINDYKYNIRLTLK